MKFYDHPTAPNPRRVRMFAAEKDIKLQSVMVDMLKGEHKTPAFLAKNPSGKIPVLELDDGTCIPESVAICRYLEALHPDPNLFGVDPAETACIEARHRQLEFELLGQVGIAWVNGPVVARMAGGRFKQIPEAEAAARAAVLRQYERLDQSLAQTPFVAGARFTVADITALITIDFATSLVELRPDDALRALWRWHSQVSSRPSAAA